MKYNPHIHHRRSIRLKGYDYSQAGAYFITICCHNRMLRFGTVEVLGPDNMDVQMILNDFGQTAYNEWAKLPERFLNVELDVFQIMPNHMHGIIILNDVVGATLAVAQDNTGNDNDVIGATLAVAQDNTGNDNDVIGATLAVAQDNTGNDNDIIGATLAVAQDNTGNDNANNRAGASPAPTGVGNGKKSRQSVILSGHTNHWWQMLV